ncbi:suppressor APC domain-containing protein 2 isoform X2 [Clupea harengus]|uniref:Suppressor APC domain-containing protein 2 isoform X2 n=1 Tax=Clupea harengus TaxID=7950 RepID=A0A6P8G2Y0_CLUHA|nr:suppressor APC domain-containing protein 2 isoform X2 [Clupea harengus]
MALVANDRSCKVNGLNSCKTGTKKERILSKTAGCKINMQPKEAEFTIEGLPKAFLQSLRTLFDILDDGTRGYVHISEIESRWQGAETQGLPAGVLECLRRVTPSHGCLTFERFVAGLRNSMLNPENGNINLQPSTQSSYSTGPKSQSQINTHKTGASMGSRSYESKVRPLGPSNMTNMHHNRASSLQSRQRYPEDIYTTSSKQGEQTHFTSAPAAQRYGTTGYERTGRSLERIPVVPESGTYRTESVRVGKKAHHQNRMRSIESLALESPQLQTQGPVETAGLPRSQSETTTGFSGSRRHCRSRDEQRRHTITNGVDYGMLKQMKELEQEKDSLLAGLEVVERAREWYQAQIHSVTERQRLVGQSSLCTDFLTESSQSRMNVLLPKLQEVNRCLNDLLSCSGMQSFSPTAQPPTISPSAQSSATAAPQAVQRLKDQNRLLTQEVTEKSERITQLEQEKSALIKQLFEARARSTHDSSTMDSTFI